MDAHLPYAGRAHSHEHGHSHEHEHEHGHHTEREFGSKP